MGAMGATFLGLEHPERFDAIGALGGPMDFTWLLAYMERSHLGGFCPLEDLETLLDTGPELLDDPAELLCMEPAPARTKAVLPEHEQSFVRWHYTDNGGSFDRNEYLDLFTDLVLALGNPLYHNPDSPHLPPGVSATDLTREDTCERPVRIPRFYNAEYNPAGTYDAITFCDGQPKIHVCKNTGRVPDPCEDPAAACEAEGGAEEATPRNRPEVYRAHAGAYRSCGDHLRRPVSFALALDLNGNGRRDHGEPIVINSHERFLDVGMDGCPDEYEDGQGGCLAQPRTDGAVDPNGDNYDWQANPTGTENDFRWQEGEPFFDHGLDGVPNTGDLGEGDGIFTEAPNRTLWRKHDARSVLPTNKSLGNIAFYADGGIRDVFNFGISAAHVWSGFAGLSPETARVYEGRASFPHAPKTEEAFDPLTLAPADLPERMLYLYGDPHASEKAIAQGDGDHVGTHRQLVNRLLLFLNWLSVRWDRLPDPPGDDSPLSSRTHSLTFVSKALGNVEREFGVVLPPGYDAKENARARYPVLLLLHGYGMKPVGPGGFVETALLWDGAMASGRIRKAIVVFPSGRCCYDDGSGQRICTEAEGAASGLPRGCVSGSFFLDRPDGPGYGTSLIELLDTLDERFRTLR